MPIDWSEYSLRDMMDIPVSSTAIASVKYVPWTGNMTVRFMDGTAYKYHFVELWTFRSLVESASVGRYFNAAIRDNYSYDEVNE